MSEWISVEDCNVKVKPNEQVLVYVGFQVQGWWDTEDQCFYDHDGEYLEDATHWRPLTPPPTT